MGKMMDEVVRCLLLVFSVTASAASGERSFCARRRVKTFLRNLMTQRRLTHLLLLHVHKKRAAEVHLDAVMKEFVSRTAELTATFGLLRQPLLPNASHEGRQSAIIALYLVPTFLSTCITVVIQFTFLSLRERMQKY
ncbi:hypothetical protein HPB49_003960 [Dermacentor silvarum]|uniref:Uncharacterized protein n=1 Tax=Dermacentor silvarum TaxID=543639 RepID=A0ACB8C214_DERSI|nr:hypothetical protein HPB49_003960 [Dermacentor silvarum]